METVVVPVIIGVIVIVLGIMNLKGNIETLHRYHRKRVSEEDRLPYGRTVGTGTILIGCSVIMMACLEYAAEELKMSLPGKTGTVIPAAGLIAGFAIIVYAMFRYNKGIF